MYLLKVQKISEQVFCPVCFLRTIHSGGNQALAGIFGASCWFSSIIPVGAHSSIPQKDNSCEFTKFISGIFTKNENAR
jgi:hypothetical protein